MLKRLLDFKIEIVYFTSCFFAIGKQLLVPLPLVRIQSSRLPVIKEGRKSPRKIHAKQKTVKTRLLPKNAGTASIIAKMEREPRLEDSPPPEINAVVVVY